MTKTKRKTSQIELDLFQAIAEIPRHEILFSFKGRFMNMHNLELKQDLRYDFKTGDMEWMHPKKKVWKHIEIPYHFFKGFDFEDLKCSSAKIKVLIKYAKEVNPRCKSIARFMSEMSEVMVYENYLEQNVKHRKPRHHSAGWYSSAYTEKLKQPLSFYPSNFIKLLKRTDIEINETTENAFGGHHKDFINRVCNMIVNMDLYDEQIESILSHIIGNSESNLEILDRYGYDIKTTLRHVFDIYGRNEGMQFSNAIQLLRDYWRMARVVKKHNEKYPKYLQSVHDIISANFEAYEEERRRIDRLEDAYISQREKEREAAKYQKDWDSKKREFLQFQGNSDLVVTIPEKPMDVMNEGMVLGHCVASYVKDIAKGRTYIFFMRNLATPDEPLVTLEYRNEAITQSKGHHNRKLTWNEFQFLQDYCAFKKIKLEIYDCDKPAGEKPEQLKPKKLEEWDEKKIEARRKVLLKKKEEVEKLKLAAGPNVELQPQTEEALLA